jgi:hypothetical protein
MTVVSIQRTRNGVLTSADTATLSIVNSAGTTVLATTTIIPESEGVYVYTTSTLPAGRYTATWVFSVVGLGTETIARAFQVDAPIELSEGIMLMELEQLVARRIGPYRRLKVGSMGSTASLLSLPRLRSSIGIGGYEDQYALRRGLTWGNELVVNALDDDRIRLVDTYDSTAGTLSVDRAYGLVPQVDEAVELHVLDPEEELRACVIDGLKRCFFWETLSISVTGNGVYNMNLTDSAAWLTDPAWIKDVSLSYPSQLMPPTRLQWWEPYRSGKDILLYTKGGAVGSVTISALRPVVSLVNGEISLSGPNDDFDVLYVKPDYAAWAGVLEAWKNHPEVLMPLAAQSMRPTRDEAAAEFTKQSLQVSNQATDRRQVDYGYSDLVQIGNLAEPAV